MTGPSSMKSASCFSGIGAPEMGGPHICNAQYFFDLGITAAIAHFETYGEPPSNDAHFDRLWDVLPIATAEPEVFARRLMAANCGCVTSNTVGAQQSQLELFRQEVSQ